MVIGLKDGLKLFGVSVVCACAVFVCTFMLNFYLDASAVRDLVAEELMPLYEAQLLTSKFVCIVSGGCLALVAVVLLVFYIKQYVEAHARQLGVLKALGYGAGRISAGFWVFGLSVLAGSALGYGFAFAYMPAMYRSMGGGGLPDVAIGFHAELLAGLVILPAAAFSALSVLYAFVKLKKPANELLRGVQERGRGAKGKRREFRSFPAELAFAALRARKLLAFFVAFGAFCFSAMLQMSASMLDLASETMGAVMLLIGIVLAATSLLLSLTSLVNASAKTSAVMRAYGFSVRVSGEAALGAFRIPAYIGFAIGTAYQYALLEIMVRIVFSDVSMPVEYSFDYAVFLIVLAAFAVFYECVNAVFIGKLGRRTVRSFVTE